MKEDILGEVVHVEKQIAKALANEEKKATEVLKELRSNSEKEIVREEKRLQYSLDKAVSEAGAKAGERASKILDHANSQADMLTMISNEVLKGIIRKHITRILP